MERIHYSLLAELFEYPDANYPQRVQNLTEFLHGRYVKASGQFLSRSGGIFLVPPVDGVESAFS